MPSNLAYHGPTGDYFASNAATGTLNAYIDRPAMLNVIGEVDGQRILDAGCGAGHHAASLVDRGASVLGLEGSAELVRHARRRLADRAEIRHYDLDKPLDILADASFDGVLCAWCCTTFEPGLRFLREVFRVLRPGGWFAISTTHPTSDWQCFNDSYFSEEWGDLDLRDGTHSIPRSIVDLDRHGFVFKVVQADR